MKKVLKIAGLGLLSSALVFSAATYAHMDEKNGYGKKDCDRHGKGDKHEKGDNRDHRGLGHMQKLMRDLDLTDDQQAAAKDIFADAKKAMEAMQDSLKESRQTMRSLMQSNEYDEDALQQAANVQANLMASKIVFMARVKADIFEILTPTQQEKLSEKLASRGPH